MTDIDILWNFYQEHCVWERHHEVQRASVTSVIVAVAAGILTVITFDKSINMADLPLSMFLLMQGVFGAIFTAKQYECFCMHQTRASRYRKRLDTLLPKVGILALRNVADEQNERKSPLFHKLRLHDFWISLHLLIVLFGLILIIGICTKFFV